MTETYPSNSAFTEHITPSGDTLLVPVANGATLKATEECEYACRRCYVFELADKIWQTLPSRMGEETIHATGEQIAAHMEAHDLPEFNVVLHGGEPFLFGRDHTKQIVQGIRSHVPNDRSVRFTAHSNAHLLGLGERSKPLLDFLEEENIGVSSSLDGDQQANDVYRLYRDGRSTYADTLKGIEALQERDLLRGILGVMVMGDIDFNKPKEVVIEQIQARALACYRSIVSLEPPRMDWLFPLGNHNDLPPGMETDERRAVAPYGVWLKTTFDEWYKSAEAKYAHQAFGAEREASRNYSPYFRIFDAIIKASNGGMSTSEVLGSLGKVSSVVIDSDGQYGIVDTLASTAEGEYRLEDMNVRNATIDQAVGAVVTRATARGMMDLPSDCAGCPVRNVCQAGYVPHRYDPNSGRARSFDHKTVYCQDMLDTIAHVNGRYFGTKVKYAGQKWIEEYSTNRGGASF